MNGLSCNNMLTMQVWISLFFFLFLFILLGFYSNLWYYAKELNFEILKQCRRNRCNALILIRERIRLIWLARTLQFLLSVTDFEKLIKFLSPWRLLTHLQPVPVGAIKLVSKKKIDFMIDTVLVSFKLLFSI